MAGGALGQLFGGGQRGDGVAGDGGARLGAAQGGIVRRQFGQQADAQGVAVCFDGLHVGVGAFDRAATPAEHIDLPTGVQPQAVRAGFADAGRVAQCAGRALRRGIGARADFGALAAGDLVAVGAGLHQPQPGDFQVLVLRQGLLHQLIEQRVVEGAPPGRQRLRVGRCRARLRGGPGRWVRGRFGLIFGPDGRAGSERGRQRDCQDGAGKGLCVGHGAGPTSRRAARWPAGPGPWRPGRVGRHRRCTSCRPPA
ncbi:hypothetical protein LMG3412_06516 [Achromobacter deleyi]|nr:hypothetical protein LMG3412_06516 [Achromobacter deleyi]